jgi:type IV secretory pathway VirJ component
MARILLVYCTFIILNIPASKGQPSNSIVDLPVQLSVSHGTHDELIIYITGDGGWNSFNEQMVRQMEQKGYGVVALNSRKYFWHEKTPEQFANDLEQLSTYYLKQWNRNGLIIVGYSFGADVASFLPHRVTDKLHTLLKKIILISPSSSTDFAIRLEDLISGSDNLSRKYIVRPELTHADLPVICTFGNEEIKELSTNPVQNDRVRIIRLPGDHGYQNNILLLLESIGI